MKKLFFAVLLVSISQLVSAQSPKIKAKKYPSLFWEITGNGLKKPSYLFGTMHVSSKMAFFLSDSFYIALKQADVVSLETNPESWQADMDKYDLGNNDYTDGMYRSADGEYISYPQDYLYKSSLAIDRYDKLMEQALYMQPSVINNLLYRNYSSYSSDFEEDTYLDLYIYQTGKKLGKQITGVEQYGESMRLMMEANSDAAFEKNRRSRSYDIDDDLRPGNLQEAYRSGNLDWLDSINKANSESEAFDAKFIYRRNEIQANSMDSIMKHSSLFVGVGAAHLPGDKGVIELLRKKGYTLRPIMMRKRDYKQKEMADRMRVPVKFSGQTFTDGFYKVNVPGKLYSYGNSGLIRQSQYADMANGSYYMVTRLKTEGLFWGEPEEGVLKKVDSMLYENVPGKILSKISITKNGYKGFDITNKTRRGDWQRYNIFVTPFELVIFKISGTGEYIRTGEEANRFFGSIQLKEPGETRRSVWQPVYGGFRAAFPHAPFVFINGEREYEAADRSTGTNFAIIQKDLHNFEFAEEDSFDLSLMQESFASSGFIDTLAEAKQEVFKGYPSLLCLYKNKDGSFTRARFLLQGPHYYTILAHGKEAGAALDKFVNSFEIIPFVYGEKKPVTDSGMYYSVNSTWYPRDGKEKIRLPEGYGKKEDDEESLNSFSRGSYKTELLENDSTGEKIYIRFFKSPRYYYSADSSRINDFYMTGSAKTDSGFMVRNKKNYAPDKQTRVWEYEVSDSNSSRMFRTKMWMKGGVGFLLVSEGDTLTPPSSFVRGFFDSFRPFDTLTGYDPFRKKSALFFDDFFSGDTLVHKKALRGISRVKFDTTDFPMIRKAVASLSWNDRKYLEAKTDFISKLAEIRTNESADFLKQLYEAAGDTVELQHRILSVLLAQKTSYSYKVFKEVITNEPPVLETAAEGNRYGNDDYGLDGEEEDDFMSKLQDSLPLTQAIFPDILPLVNLDDYESPMMDLLEVMIDSNRVSKKEYALYFNKFFLEAKHELKKQRVIENMKSIRKASSEDTEDEEEDYTYPSAGNDGNEKLSQYTTLLLPYYDENENVRRLFSQVLSTGDNRVKYTVMLKLLTSGKKIPDTLVNYYAGLDEYRYELYQDLKEMEKSSLFPSVYNNHLALAKSKLTGLRSYNKPDSLTYLNRYLLTYKDRTGYIYFFKYKEKKDDAGWKIASIGMVPVDSSVFEFKDDTETAFSEFAYSVVIPGWNTEYLTDMGKYSFSGFSETRLEDDKTVERQMQEYIRKKIYSKRKSARYFYREQTYGDYGLGNFRY